MSSVFGFPHHQIDNIANNSSHIEEGIEFAEKTIFVGGLYQAKHLDIFSLFQYKLTPEAGISEARRLAVHNFVLLPIIIILLCQLGFTCLLSGTSKAENAGAPFIVSLINFAVSGFCFWAIGYPIARTSGVAFVGYSHWFSYDVTESMSIDWLLYFCLVLTAVNIASFGPMERCPLWIYGVLAAVISGLVCPAAIRWSWHHSGWLQTMTLGTGVKYVDMGGAGAVHAVGGGAALVCSVMMGSRHNMIRLRKSRILMNDREGHSIPLEVLGGYLVLLCLTCTNAVRLLSTCITCEDLGEFSRAIQNTIIAASSSFLVTIATVAGLRLRLGHWRLLWPVSRLTLNALTVGIVSVSAGSHLFPSWAACTMGVTSALGYVAWSLLLYTLRIDNPVGVISVHLGGAIWSVIGVALFRSDTGAVFEQNKVVFLSLLWNFIGILSMIGMSAVVIALMLLVPKLLKSIPVTGYKDMEGLDEVLLKQRAYQAGGNIAAVHVNRSANYDAEHALPVYSPTSQQQLMSPPSFRFHGFQAQDSKQDAYIRYLEEEVPMSYRDYDMNYSMSPGVPTSPNLYLTYASHM